MGEHSNGTVDTGQLSEEQVEFFDQNGYLILRNWVPQALLERLRASATQWIAAGRSGNPGPDYQFAERPSGKVMFRIDYLHDKGEPASLELLGSPAVLGVAASLAGPNVVPTYEAMVFKNEGDGAPIAWHQDAVHPRNSRIFTFDIWTPRAQAPAPCGSSRAHIAGRPISAP